MAGMKGSPGGPRTQTQSCRQAGSACFVVVTEIGRGWKKLVWLIHSEMAREAGQQCIEPPPSCVLSSGRGGLGFCAAMKYD